MSSFWQDVATGAVSTGVNGATFLALNAVLLAAIFSLILLLAFSLTANPALVPHVLVLIFLAVGLWGLMIWLIGVVGVQEAEQQPQPQHEQQQQQQQVSEADADGTDKKQA